MSWCRRFDVTLRQLLNLSRSMELKPLLDTLRTRWVGLDPLGADAVIGSITTSVGDRGEVRILFEGKPVHAEIVTDPAALRLTVDPPPVHLAHPTADEIAALAVDPGSTSDGEADG